MTNHEHDRPSSSPTPSRRGPSPSRRVRTKRHPALRTRRGLAVGTVVATAGLAGVYWAGDLATSTTATASSESTSTESSSSSSLSPSSGTSSSGASVPSQDSSSSFDSNVDVAPSTAAPDTSSRAS